MTWRVVVVGLGRMGLPVATRLATAGFLVTGLDISPYARERARAAGTNVLDNEPAAGDVDVLLTVVPGSLELVDVMDGPNGFAGRLRPGTFWLDCTSADPRVASRLANTAASRGIVSVGAPMRGGPADAAAGTLGFYLGGDPEPITQVIPVLTAIGTPDRFSFCGPHISDGYTSKLIANTLWFGQVAAVSEMLLLGQRLGLDVGTLRQVLQASPAGSVFLDQPAGALLAGDYLPSFGIDRVVEELQTIVELVSDAGTPSDLTQLIARLHEEALDRFGPVDGELLLAKLLEERAGTVLRPRSTTG